MIPFKEILYIYSLHILSKYITIEPNVYIRTRSLAMTQWNTFKICVYKQREVKKLNSSTKRMYAY